MRRFVRAGLLAGWVFVTLLALTSSEAAAVTVSIGLDCTTAADPVACAQQQQQLNAICVAGGGTVAGTGAGTTCTISNAAGLANNSTALTQSATTASIVSTTAVQSAVREMRDRLQRRNPAAQQGGAPQGLAAAPMLPGSSHIETDAFVGQATAAPPRARPIGAWVQGFGDRELRDSNTGHADGRIANTTGVIGGVDYTMLGARDAFLIGVLSGYTDAHIKNRVGGAKTRLDGASVGVYGVYVNGGFSLDFNSKVDMFDVDQTGSQSTDLRNYVSAANLNYKIYGSAGVWLEPTVGVIYTVSRWGDNFSALDGHTLRVQGGARVGTSFVWHGITIEPTVTGLLYSDVDIHAGTIGVGLVSPNDEGRVFKQGILRLNFDYGRGLSTSIEGEIRHGDLADNADMLGFAGRVGLRYQW